jgi:hypothetical protein
MDDYAWVPYLMVFLVAVVVTVIKTVWGVDLGKGYEPGKNDIVSNPEYSYLSCNKCYHDRDDSQ